VVQQLRTIAACETRRKTVVLDLKSEFTTAWMGSAPVEPIEQRHHAAIRDTIMSNATDAESERDIWRLPRCRMLDSWKSVNRTLDFLDCPAKRTFGQATILLATRLGWLFFHCHIAGCSQAAAPAAQSARPRLSQGRGVRSRYGQGNGSRNLPAVGTCRVGHTCCWGERV
jgi:hypothetical protein